ncbi:MAG: hypothetical protein MUO26_14695 [Methanotrichaceae archaeon]|nr:hypothetical protein [Methanotrichaceae archaeon]
MSQPFSVFISRKALRFIDNLPDKSQRIIKEKCLTLGGCPFPGEDPGDKEFLDIPGPTEVYRLHISRSYTAFYGISADDKIVYIRDVMVIEQAHNLYGRFRKSG